MNITLCTTGPLVLVCGIMGTHVSTQHGFVYLLLMQVSKVRRENPWISYMNT